MIPIGFERIWAFKSEKTLSCETFCFIRPLKKRDYLILIATQNASSVPALWHLILDWYVEEMSWTAGPTVDCFFDPFLLRCASNAARRSICSPNWWMWCPHGGLFAFSLCQLSFFLSSSSASSPPFFGYTGAIRPFPKLHKSVTEVQLMISPPSVKECYLGIWMCWLE